ncbi:hypothetical protein HUB98_05940 [Paenibacillus barcinonensis]|uniref:Uncharacterized protein n=1 Tax=Paenibacillus barcinonensis TaxID=198119 RepID=A0A2V4VW63_PAEBA|nr:hypothetical protein [Paenibacillus barcinonensis]PYE51546.1 hypothetical protein DFQ00_102340 [Paenibacillus barcinonensis]QKS55922.1 hypothetical protein HUB98_05940 [Paenibacillus barcinonensis]
MEKLKCTDPECIELYENEWEDIELILYVEETMTTQYKILENGVLNLFDSDNDGQKVWLRCPCCDGKYEFKQEYVEVEKCARLDFDIKDEENLQIERVKESWER